MLEKAEQAQQIRRTSKTPTGTQGIGVWRNPETETIGLTAVMGLEMCKRGAPI